MLGGMNMAPVLRDPGDLGAVGPVIASLPFLHPDLWLRAIYPEREAYVGIAVLRV